MTIVRPGTRAVVGARQVDLFAQGPPARHGSATVERCVLDDHQSPSPA